MGLQLGRDGVGNAMQIEPVLAQRLAVIRYVDHRAVEPARLALSVPMTLAST